MAEMRELARACVAQIEERIARMEAAIREADERLARLDAARTAEAPAVTVRRIEPIRPPGSTPIGSDELSQRIFSLADEGRTAVDIARELAEHTGKVELILALREESRRSAVHA